MLPEGILKACIKKNINMEAIIKAVHKVSTHEYTFLNKLWLNGVLKNFLIESINIATTNKIQPAINNLISIISPNLEVEMMRS